VNYSKEYDKENVQTLVVVEDCCKEGDNVLLCDDLLATGGSLLAGIELMEKCKANVVGCCLVIELDFLKGREKLEKKCPVFSLIHVKE
jgi:adenine phosphoribosyltransferase